MKHRLCRILVLIVLFAAGEAHAFAENTMRAHFIDVGQGDATLLEFSCGAVLIDAGGGSNADSRRLMRYLRDFFTERPDLQGRLSTLFVTHTHVDHNRTLRQIVEADDVTVVNYVHNGIFNGSGRHAAKFMRDHANDDGRSITQRAIADDEITALSHRRGLRDRAIDPVACSGIDPEIVVLSGRITKNPGWPAHEMNNGNNHSLTIRIRFGRASFLFTGDLEEPALETLVAYYDGTRALDVDVYQLGHHGS
ncbi:MAG TPA: MBL fold metallo-hydrolase, partial [Polyangiaceae bacterium]